MDIDTIRAKLTNWLLSQGRQCSHPGEFFEGLCQIMRQNNLPVDRATIGAPLLHPVAQSSFSVWDGDDRPTTSWALWDASGLEKLRGRRLPGSV